MNCKYCQDRGCLHCPPKKVQKLVMVPCGTMADFDHCLVQMEKAGVQFEHVHFTVHLESAAAWVHQVMRGEWPPKRADVEALRIFVDRIGEILDDDGSRSTLERLFMGGDGADRPTPPQEPVNTEPHDLQEARRMLSKWEQHSSGYAYEQRKFYRDEIFRLEKLHGINTGE